MNTAYTPKFANAAAIEKAIASIHTRGKKLDADIQQCGLSVLVHIDKCGDITLFERLYASMPTGMRRNALVEWATQFGKLVVNLDDSSKKAKPFLFSKTKATNIEGAIEKPWYDCKPEKPVDEEFDFAAALTSLLNRAKKAQAEGKVIKGAEQLNALLGAEAPKPISMAVPAEVELAA